MPEADVRVPIGRRIRHGLRKHRFPVSAFVLAVGVLLTTLAAGYFLPLKSSYPFTAINPATTYYNLVFVIVGPIVIIAGIYLVGSYYNARRKFEHLMLTKSKAEFLRNIPEVEDLLWDLTPDDERRYEAKRAELRLRR